MFAKFSFQQFIVILFVCSLCLITVFKVPYKYLFSILYYIGYISVFFSLIKSAVQTMLANI